MKRTLPVLLLAMTCAAASAAQESDAVPRLLQRLVVGKPVAYRGLTVFPLSGCRAPRLDGCLTLGEAMGKGWITISEKDGGEVNRLIIENTGPSPVFLMAGELLTGCKQDRIVGDDCLLPARSGKVTLSAYCVEHGRWTEQGRAFKATGVSAQTDIRRAAKASRSQQEVWDQVAANYDRLAVPMSATGAYRSVVEDQGVAAKRDEYVRHISNLPSLGRDVCGCAVAVAGRIVCVDAFGSPRLFARLWPSLAASYAMDALGCGEAGPPVSREDVNGLLAAAARARRQPGKTDGIGRACELRSAGLYGSALVYLDDVVHCDLFPVADGGNGPDDSDAPRLRYRREHLRER